MVEEIWTALAFHSKIHVVNPTQLRYIDQTLYLWRLALLQLFWSEASEKVITSFRALFRVLSRHVGLLARDSSLVGIEDGFFRLAYT